MMGSLRWGQQYFLILWGMLVVMSSMIVVRWKVLITSVLNFIYLYISHSHVSVSMVSVAVYEPL